MLVKVDLRYAGRARYAATLEVDQDSVILVVHYHLIKPQITVKVPHAFDVDQCFSNLNGQPFLQHVLLKIVRPGLLSIRLAVFRDLLQLKDSRRITRGLKYHHLGALTRPEGTFWGNQKNRPTTLRLASP